MVHESSRYSSNHPKDVAARRMQEMQRSTKEQGCTKTQLDNPTERNVNHCMKEMANTSKSGEQFKKDAKFLGERSDVNDHRRR